MAHARGSRVTISGLLEVGMTPSQIAVEARLPGPGSVLRVLRGRWISLGTATKLRDAGLGLTLDGLARETAENQ
jgi:hypothetical protein